MFLRAFKTNSPVSILLIPLLTGFLWLHTFIYPVQSQASNIHSMPLYEFAIGWLLPYPFLLSFLAFVFVVLSAFLFSYLVNEQEFLSRRSFLPALLYCLLMSSQAVLLNMHPIIFANLFIILSLNTLLNMYRLTISYKGAFETGLCIALASLFYFPSVVLVLFLFIALGVLRPFIWREWLISVIGFCFPWLYVFVYYYWHNNVNYLVNEKILYALNSAHLKWEFITQRNPILWLYTGTMLLSLLWWNTGFSGQKLKTQKGYTLLFWMIPILFCSVFVAGEISMFTLSLLVVPSAIIFSNYFYTLKRTWIARLLLWIFYLTPLVIIWADKIYSQ